jgi:hypothetical protein
MLSLLQAASLLKRTEGVVTLVVCNPNKAKEEEKKAVEADVCSPTPTPQPSAVVVSPAPKEPEKPSEFHSVFVCLAVTLTNTC